MGLSYREINLVKDLQVTLKELGLYTGVIDGIWGNGSASATNQVLRDYDYQKHGIKYEMKGVSGHIPGKSRKEIYDIVMMDLQRSMKHLRLYTGVVDGLYGPMTETALKRLVRDYRAYNKVRGLDICHSANKNVSKEFLDMVKDYCNRRDLYEGAASGLMACMHFESGGTYDPSIRNFGGSNFYGLIQFGKAAASDLGFTLDQIRKMGQLEQLEKAVFPYFDMWNRRGKKVTQLEDFYLSILYPAAVGKKADTEIFVEGTVAYRQNSGLDVNKDGLVTVGEISKVIYDTYYSGMDPRNRLLLPKVHY